MYLQFIISLGAVCVPSVHYKSGSCVCTFSSSINDGDDAGLVQLVVLIILQETQLGGGGGGEDILGGRGCVPGLHMTAVNLQVTI